MKKVAITVYVTAAGPGGAYIAGRSYDADSDVAVALIKAGSARPTHEEPAEDRRAVTGGEKATKPPKA